MLKVVKDTRDHTVSVRTRKEPYNVAAAFEHEVSFKDYREYPEVIKTIMDLDCIEAKLLAAHYADVFAVLDDANLIESNCKQFCTHLQKAGGITRDGAEDLLWCANQTVKAFASKTQSNVAEYDYKRTSLPEALVINPSVQKIAQRAKRPSSVSRKKSVEPAGAKSKASSVLDSSGRSSSARPAGFSNSSSNSAAFNSPTKPSMQPPVGLSIPQPRMPVPKK